MGRRNKRRQWEPGRAPGRVDVSRDVWRDSIEAATRAGAFDPIDLGPSVQLANATRWRLLSPVTPTRPRQAAVPGRVLTSPSRVTVAAGPPAALKPRQVAMVQLHQARLERSGPKRSALGEALKANPALPIVRQSHDSSSKMRDQRTCKARPDNKKRTRGSGAGRKFVPWCRR